MISQVKFNFLGIIERLKVVEPQNIELRILNVEV